VTYWPSAWCGAQHVKTNSNNVVAGCWTCVPVDMYVASPV
jgi:hypothetical protein